MPNRVPTAERDDDPLFVKNGVPVKFCFHRSVTQGRGQITRDVERHGGQIVQDERHANVLLVDEQQDLHLMRTRYYNSTERYRLEIYVEPRGFVQACIRDGSYYHLEPSKRRMPGSTRGGGRTRISFTEEDRDHLAYYLATRCPTRDGRMGNSAYKDLEQLGQTNDRCWTWARRHTWHSWREHYKMRPAMMDVRIDHYLQRLKNVGHHFGHDPRTRHNWELREEEEEDEDEEEEEGQGRERRENERREQAPPAVAGARQPRDHPVRHARDLATFDEEESDGAEEVTQEIQRAKRHAQHPRDIQQTQAKRARVSEARRVVEAGRGESSPAREKDTGDEESQEIEGSDLFGDRAYEEEVRLEFGDDQDVNFSMPLSPRASPVPERDGAPPSTQATLIASPLAAEKEPSPAPGPTPTEVIKSQVSTIRPTAPPSSQQTAVVTQERVVAPRARIRGASAQPGPSVPKEKRVRGGVAMDAPYRNTRARSRSVDPQPRPTPELQPLRQQGTREGRGKGKAKAEVLVSIEEGVDVEEEVYAEEEVEVVTGVLSTRETSEDEIAVEDLLEASIGSGVNDKDGGGDVASVEDVVDEDSGNSDVEEDEDGGIISELPRFQDIGIESEPSDSDDAETHESLVRGVQEGPIGGSGSSQGQDQDQDEEDADADRIERMARGSLHVALARTVAQPRVTRSMPATQSQGQTQTRTQTQVSPRRTRSRNQAPKVFPSPGTKARVVVDRVREEDRREPYVPPEGSRAARAVRGRGKRG